MDNKTKSNSLGRRGKLLIALISAFIFIALALTSVLWFGGRSVGKESPRTEVEDVPVAEATESAVGNKTLTSVGTYDYRPTNTATHLANGNIISMSYTGSGCYTIILPKGTYTFYCWGAEGGSVGSGANTGGLGGYAYGNYTSTTDFTVYVYIGGKGSDSSTGIDGGNDRNVYYGGYNGGGAGSGIGGPGGGGCTDMRIGGTSYTYQKIVAGGGGGGITRSTGNTPSGSSRYYGQSGCYSRHSSRYSNDEGGGGGGYYGGNTIHGDDPRQGYAGSNYVTGLASTYSVNGNRAGNGYAQIKAVSVNQNPTDKKVTLNALNSNATYYRGDCTINVTPANIATDPEGSTMYFTNGDSNLDTFSATANAGVYINSGCSVAASNYINWTWTSNTTLRINKILRYPRNGVDYCTADGKLTLYTKVRDNFGSSGTGRGWSIVTFYLLVTDRQLTAKTTNFSNSLYRYGTPTVSGLANQNNNYVVTSDIYNPASATAKTIFLPKPISPTDTTTYSINASDIYTDADGTSYDYVAFKSATALSGYPANGSYYNVSIPSNSAYASSVGPTLTIKANGTRPPDSCYVVMQLEAWTSEKVSKAVIGSANKTVNLVFKIANTRPYFASTAAMPSGVNLSEPLISLTTSGEGSTKSLRLDQFLYDVDDSSLNSTFRTGANDVVVPVREYIQVDITNEPVPLKTDPVSNYAGRTTVNNNAGEKSCDTGMGVDTTGFSTDLIAPTNASTEAINRASVLYSFDKECKTITFTARAATQYQYKMPGRVGDFYILVHVNDPSDASDEGIWFPIAIKVTTAAPTEVKGAATVDLTFSDATQSVNDPQSDDPDTNGNPGTPQAVYLTPLSYVGTDNNKTVHGIGATGNDFKNNSDSAHAQPFVTDSDGFMYPVGNVATSVVNPLNDVVMLKGVNPDTGTFNNTLDLYDTDKFFKVTAQPLFAAKSVFSRIYPGSLSFLGVRDVEGNEEACTFWGLKIMPLRSTNGEYYRFDVHVIDSHNEESVIPIYVNVANRRVNLRVLNKDWDEGKAVDAAVEYPINMAGKGVYKKMSAVASSYVVNYTIERYEELFITPYDYAYDFDFDPGLNDNFNPVYDSRLNPAGGAYNTNPADEEYNTAFGYITQKYSVPHTENPEVGMTAASLMGDDNKVTLQRLYFQSKSAIEANANLYSSYIGVDVLDNDSTNSVPRIKITGRNRTTTAVVQLKFDITDGFSTVSVTVVITVRNAAPVLNTETAHPIEEGGSNERVREPYNLSVKGAGTSYEFTASLVGYDRDDDNMRFVAGSVSIVALDNGSYYPYLAVSNNGAATTYTGKTEDEVRSLISGFTAKSPDDTDRISTVKSQIAGGASLQNYDLTYFGIIDLSKYISSAITKNNVGVDVIYVRALSSTELISKPVYVQFGITDSYDRSTLRILLNVTNTQVSTSFAEGIVTTGATGAQKNTWLINYEDASELKLTRYIVNSKELYEATEITSPSVSGVVMNPARVPTANKVYLFEDADEAQQAILNPAAWVEDGNAYDTTKLVEHINTAGANNTRIIIEDKHFDTTQGGYGNAAVVYGRTYFGEEEDDDNRYLQLTVEFYEKLPDGSFRAIQNSSKDVRDCPYWAIKIVDKSSPSLSGSSDDTQIAIAVKDNHHGEDVWTADKKTSSTGNSQLKIFNFYFKYQSPGLMAMHTYYRTDVYTESRTSANPALAAGQQGYGDYALDYKAFLTALDYSYLFQGGMSGIPSFAQIPDGANAEQIATISEANQNLLRGADFATGNNTDIRYSYFVKSYTNGNETSITYKRFPTDTNKFFYKPIQVGESAVTVPISYLAMPKGVSASTEGTNVKHVTFANACTDPANQMGVTVGGYQQKLNDTSNNFRYWGSAATINAVFENVTLYDPLTNITYGGLDPDEGRALNDNPYITFEYTAVENDSDPYLDSSYVNTKRSVLQSYDSTGITLISGSPTFREDRYGFKITKKTAARRTTQNLKLTVLLKTAAFINGEAKDDSVEKVDVEIAVNNSKPTLNYREGGLQWDDAEVYLPMTMNITAEEKANNKVEPGKILALNSQENIDSNKITGDEYLIYSDRDKTDQMVFYMSSALTTTPGQNGMTDEELNYLNGTSLKGGTRTPNKYFNTSNVGSMTLAQKRAYEPNPGYSDFFTVSPINGLSSTIQFTPVAKTQLNLDTNHMQDSEIAAYLDRYHLAADVDNENRYVRNNDNNPSDPTDKGSVNIYYPFKVIAYDALVADNTYSSLTQGSWALITVKVWIKNTEMSVNEALVTGKYKPTSNVGQAYNGKYNYKISLAADAPFYVDVSSILVDKDMGIKDDLYFVLKSDWDNYGDGSGTFTKRQLTSDYLRTVDNRLAVPAPSSTTGSAKGFEPDKFKLINTDDYSLDPSSDKKLPITVRGNGGMSTISDTTIVFSTDHAFKTPADLLFTFADSNDSRVDIVFTVSYNNEAPKPNTDTFGEGDSINVKMRTGDRFNVYAADGSLFEGDKNGGFRSVSNIRRSCPTYPTSSAQTLFSSFKPNDPGAGDLGSFVLASDDAPSTLRITSCTRSNPNTENAVELTPGPSVAGEYTSSAPMSYTITAKGVCNVTLYFVVQDSEDVAVTIKVFITVESTAPEARTTLLNGTGTNAGEVGVVTTGIAPVQGTPGMFETTLNYNGAPKEFKLLELVRDIDDGDLTGLSVNPESGNILYTVSNPSGKSVVDVQSGSINGVESIKLQATDFIDNANQYADVSFRVKDKHGAVSDNIVIRVYIPAATLTPVATVTAASDRSYAYTLKSYADYVADGEEKVLLDLVNLPGGATTLFTDTDANAPSAMYDIYVYAMLEAKEDGTYEAMNANTFDRLSDGDKQGMLLYSIEGNRSQGYSHINDVCEYVDQFFYLTVSNDGKTLILEPRSATISAGSNPTLAPIPMQVVMRKHYRQSQTSATMLPQKAYMRLSVANSSVVAVESSTFNAGYPQIKTTGANGNTIEKARDSQFLDFVGTAGDSLTWDLYNTENKDIGLFYDYDMMNNEDGLERLSFVKAETTKITELITGKGEVLSISASNDGKITIKINRKTYFAQPPAEGFSVSYTEMQVFIYAADTLGYRAYRADPSSNTPLVMTTINVRIENDVPEIKTGSKEALNGMPGYTISYTDKGGYVLDATFEKDKFIELNIADIIEDADIAMDMYVMEYTKDEYSLMSSDNVHLSGSNGGTIGQIKATSGNSTPFDVFITNGANSFGVSTMTKFTITCVSTARGETAKATVKFRDSVKGATTSLLTINLTVGNIAAKLSNDYIQYKDDGIPVTIMGVGKDATEEEIAKQIKSSNIVNYITDENGDAYIPSEETASRTPTFTYIDEILVYSLNDILYTPTVYGPGTIKPEDMEDESWESTKPTTACTIGYFVDDAKNQSFAITPMPGVYGIQYVSFTIVDSGSDDGLAEGITDGKQTNVLFKITVANPLNDVAEEITGDGIAYGVTTTVTAADVLGEENAFGYEINAIREKNNTNYFKIQKLENGEWSITATVEDAVGEFDITFKAGDIERHRTFTINTLKNNAPRYKNGKKKYDYVVSKLTDPSRRTLKVYPEDWFEDPDDNDVMSFVRPATSLQTVKVETHLDFDENDRMYLLLTFNRRGAADIDLIVRDLSDNSYKMRITVNCTDAPDLSWWENFVSLIEANLMWFWIIVAAVVVLIVLLIVLLVILHKRRKMRREIEMLLNSETELEEEMMRLGMGSSMPYQSFGYLPPTTQTVNNPGFMLGGSPANPTPNGLQLNAGTGMNPTGTQPIPPTQAAPGATPPPAGDDGFDPSDF